MIMNVLSKNGINWNDFGCVKQVRELTGMILEC